MVSIDSQTSSGQFGIFTSARLTTQLTHEFIVLKGISSDGTVHQELGGSTETSSTTKRKGRELKENLTLFTQNAAMVAHRT